MRIALRTAFGYMTAEGGGEAQPKRGLVTSNRHAVGAWEIWTVEARGAGIALKSCDGFYLCAEGGGGSKVYANRSQAQSWETFYPSGPIVEGISVTLVTADGVHALVANPSPEHVVDASGYGMPFTIEVIESDSASAAHVSDLHVDDVDFRDADGQRVVLCETTNFLQFYRFIRHEDLTPTLYAGFTLDRVTLSMKWVPEQLGWPVLDMVDDPQFQPLVRSFCEWKRSISRRTEFTVICDRHDLQRDMAWAARLLNLTYEVLADFKENLVEFGNEVLDGEQGLDLPYLVSQVNRRGVVSCSGSGLTGGPVPEPYLDYTAAHLTRGPLAKMLADANMGEQVYGSWPEHPTPTRRPMLTNEMKGAGEADSDSRYTDPRIAKEVARAFSGRNGGAFHATDAVFSRPLGPKQEVSRAAFVDGMKGF